MTARSVMKSLTIALLAVLALLWSGLAGAADLKVGKVDIQTIYTKSVRIKKAVQDMQQIQNEGQSKLLGLTSEVQSLQSKFDAAKTQAEKDKIKAELDAKSETLESERQTVGFKLSLAQQNIRNQFTNELQAIVEKAAKAKGLSVVFADGSLLYSSGIPDLTKEVLEELDKIGATPAVPKAAPATPRPAPAKPSGPSKGGPK